MKRCIILYESRYGCTLKYANWLSELIGCEKTRVEELDLGLLKDYDTVILAGSVFFSGILGIRFLHRHYNRLSGKKLAVLMVGASPAEPEVIQALSEKNLVEKCGAIPCFYVRGDWHRRERSFMDRRLFDLQLKTLQKENRIGSSGWDRALLSCAHTEGDWSSPEQLGELIRFLMEE